MTAYRYHIRQTAVRHLTEEDRAKGLPATYQEYRTYLQPRYVALKGWVM